VWSNRVFTTRRDFETWLASRGSNYELWSQRHPVVPRHFDNASRSLAASASAQYSRRQAQSGTALLIAIISCSVLLAMLALPTAKRLDRTGPSRPDRFRAGRPRRQIELATGAPLPAQSDLLRHRRDPLLRDRRLDSDLPSVGTARWTIQHFVGMTDSPANVAPFRLIHDVETQESLSLPMYPELTEEQIRSVTDVVREFFASGRAR
jgi:hypothetical protein